MFTAKTVEQLWSQRDVPIQKQLVWALLGHGDHTNHRRLQTCDILILSEKSELDAV